MKLNTRSQGGGKGEGTEYEKFPLLEIFTCLLGYNKGKRREQGYYIIFPE